MDRLNEYRKIVCGFLKDFAKNDANAQLIFDIARDRYLVMHLCLIRIFLNNPESFVNQGFWEQSRHKP